MRTLLFSLLVILLNVSCGNSQDGKLYMRTMSWGGSLDIAWYYVTKDKIVVNPVNGANPVNMQVEMQRNRRNVASYRKSADGKMQVDWGDGRSQNVRVEYKNGDISAFDGGLMSKAKPFSGSRFQDKTYTGLASNSQVTRTVTIFFGKDGRFQMNRIGSVTGGTGTSGVGASEKADQGTYEIKGNTIHFRYDNGTEWRPVGQPYDLGNEEIILGDQLFKKKG